MRQYTVKEVSALLGVNPRAIQKRCVRANLDMTKGVYLIPEKVFVKWKDKKERTSNMKVVYASISDTKNSVRTRELNVPDYASISERPLESNLETEKLKDEINNLKDDLLSHNKLFRAMYDRLKSLESDEFNGVAETIKEKLPKPPLKVYNNNYPPATEDTVKDGKKVQGKPSMNDINFRSSYDANWNKNKD